MLKLKGEKKNYGAEKKASIAARGSNAGIRSSKGTDKRKRVE